MLFRSKANYESINKRYIIAEYRMNVSQKSDQTEIYFKEKELEAQKKKIEQLKDELTKLKLEEESVTIIAPEEGTVSKINYRGGVIEPGVTLLEIQMLEKSNYAEIQLVEEIEDLLIGTEVYVNDYMGQLVEAVVKSNTYSEEDGTLLTLSLGREVEVGSRIIFNYIAETKTYASVIPSSALRYDITSKYILKLTSKKTPLGERYFSVRCNVEVLDNDDSTIAITGDFDINDRIITLSSKPIEVGDYVRVKD